MALLDTRPAAPPRGFRQMYRAHYGLVWHALHRFGVAPACLEDATQDTFLIAHRRWSSRQGESVKGWLYGIARRVASNYRRTASRRVRKVAALSQVLEPSATAVQPAHAYEAVVALDSYLDALPREDRELFVLSELEGMTGPEIARSLGTNLNTTYGRIRKLRSRFEIEGGVHPTMAELRRVEQERPRASARSWALLMPLLGEAPRTLARFAPALAANKLAGFALGASVAGGVVVLADQALSTPAEHIDVVEAGEGSRAPAPHTTGVAEARVGPRAESAAAALDDGTLASEAPLVRHASRSRRPQPAAPEDDRSLSTQNEQLRQASSALRRGDPAAALEITSRQDREFPGGQLFDLRTALRIEALCALGDGEAARQAAESFLGRHPSSPVAPRVRRSCGVERNRPEPDTSGA
jgi:RNA polymerase sigma-70 factor, ECF subfamily